MSGERGFLVAILTGICYLATMMLMTKAAAFAGLEDPLPIIVHLIVLFGWLAVLLYYFERKFGYERNKPWIHDPDWEEDSND